MLPSARAAGRFFPRRSSRKIRALGSPKMPRTVASGRKPGNRKASSSRRGFRIRLSCRISHLEEKENSLEIKGFRGLHSDFLPTRLGEEPKLFVAVGDILEREGPTSYKQISAKLAKLQREGSLDRDVETNARTIAVKIKRLEKLLGQKEGRTIMLTDRGSTTRGGLTPDGEAIHERAKTYLKLISNNQD
jgi:hypothetical protein